MHAPSREADMNAITHLTEVETVLTVVFVYLAIFFEARLASRA
jgi:hypothetical protein